jgi:tetratricopeptide (TPR) repeat protein
MRCSWTPWLAGAVFVIVGCSSSSEPVDATKSAPAPTPSSPPVASATDPSAPTAKASDRLDHAKSDLPAPAAPGAAEPAPAPDANELLKQADIEFRSGNLDGAVAKLEDVLKLNPEHTGALMGVSLFLQTKAQQLLQGGKQAEAEPLFLRSGECYHKVVEINQGIRPANPNFPIVVYNEACVFALRKQPEKALASLEESIELGFADRPANMDTLNNDADLSTLRELPKFKELITKAKKRAESAAPPNAPKGAPDAPKSAPDAPQSAPDASKSAPEKKTRDPV